MAKIKEMRLNEYRGYRAIKANRVCAECGGELKMAKDARRGNQKGAQDQAYFCQPKCRIAYNNRMKVRGAKIMPFLMEWRKGPRCAEALAQACTMIGRWIDEDKQAGRDCFVPNYWYRNVK